MISLKQYYKSNKVFTLFIISWTLAHLIFLLVSNCTWGIFPDYPKLFFPFCGYPRYLYDYEKNPVTLLVYTYSYSEFLVYTSLPFVIKYIHIRYKGNKTPSYLEKKTENSFSNEYDFEKQKTTIEELIKNDIYNESEGKSKIAEIEARQLEINKNKEKREKNEKALESLSFLLKTNVITEIEFNEKVSRINSEYNVPTSKSELIIEQSGFKTTKKNINDHINITEVKHDNTAEVFIKKLILSFFGIISIIVMLLAWFLLVGSGIEFLSPGRSYHLIWKLIFFILLFLTAVFLSYFAIKIIRYSFLSSNKIPPTETRSEMIFEYLYKAFIAGLLYGIWLYFFIINH
jgi:ABC-type multidrug transport system fused ATPase/permease subunit